MQKEFEFFITKVYHGVGAARKLGDIVKKVGKCLPHFRKAVSVNRVFMVQPATLRAVATAW